MKPASVSQIFRTALREPLLHFLLAGLAVFVFFSWRGVAVDPASRTITIGEEQVAQLSATWTQTMQRQPTPIEIDALIRDAIKEEIYAREAVRLGLDQDDAIIRRRLRLKMESLAAAQIENAVPSDQALQKMLNTNPAKYAAGSRYSFDQVYLGNSSETDAKPVLQALAKGGDWQKMGTAISLPRSMDKTNSADIARTFGEPFAQSVQGIKTDQWQGPLISGFGSHLVRITNVEIGARPTLSAVRQLVENDWRAVTMREREGAAYQALLDGYTIKIAKP